MSLYLYTYSTQDVIEPKILRHEFTGNEVFDIIYSIPGFGILSSAYVTCMGDDFSRFSDGRGYAASIGLTPKQRESNDIGPQCGITRRGDPDLRRIMTMATFVHIHHADSFITRKYERLRKMGKSHNEALVACANSMARMVFKMVISKAPYVCNPKELVSSREYIKNGNVEDDMDSSDN